MLQRNAHELAKLPFGEITHPDDRAVDRAFFDEILDGSRDGFKREKRYLRPDGSIVEAELTVIAMRKASGEVVRLLSMIEDVTEAKRTQRQLIERATQLELAMEAVRGARFTDVSCQRRIERSGARVRQPYPRRPPQRTRPFQPASGSSPGVAARPASRCRRTCSEPAMSG